ncbi:hypothetical protein PGB34_17665 [Xenophilus arseniciresistens]|uniref:Chorismatase FkbO/Hyg5-like N-terminal domain-containing protein n=1 Tax=Xenophilus arseniciresistens TaxID=1283306 RepID=A0AAE3NCA6_9BURK|nr:hypothetical protein [Xenophilus arseniciresistens]MDA7418196.1 hypothetical protein [Xenophilus arseniciresistens]
MQRQPAGLLGGSGTGAELLGGLHYGGPGASTPADGVLHALSAPALLDSGHCADLWTTGAPARAGQTGCVRWRSSGPWLFGAADLGAADAHAGIEALAQRAYADLFATLQGHGQPALLRLWNYLPHITGDDGAGMERYRRFNIGRQRAFLDAGQRAFEGAPAACALGLRSGDGLTLRFVAGHTEVRAIENPRQVPAWRYPADYGPRAPTFSRAALAALGDGQLALLVSGTASIVGHASQHAGDTPAQVNETLRNLQAVFEAARAQCSAPFALEDSEPVVYLRHAQQAQAVREQLAQALGPQSRFMQSAVFLAADVCRPELDVEIETQACATGQLTPSSRGTA